MIFRIYRLPGSRAVWHVDSGPDTQIINVLGFDCRCASHAVDLGDVATTPRAWIEIVNAELHIIDGIAFFDLFDRKKWDTSICSVAEGA